MTLDDDLPLARAYHWERVTPDRAWLHQPMSGGELRVLSFRQALDEARRMAAHLISLGLPPGSHVALLSKNTAWWALADLAIWMAGHVSVPLYPTLAADTVRQILAHSDSRLIFVGKLDAWPAMAPGIPDDLPRIYLPLSPERGGTQWADVVAQTAPLAASPTRGADELATVIYTSGTTGQAKGVMHSFRTMAVASRTVVDLYGIGPQDRVLSYLPLAHVTERWAVECAGLIAGGQAYFAESIDTFVADLRRARPTLFISVPRLWVKFQAGVHAKLPPAKLQRLLAIPLVRGVIRKKVLRGLGLDSVRLAATGSAPLPAEVLAWYRRLGLELLEGYGMTENFALSHSNRLGRDRVGYVGEPYPGVTQRISEDGEVQVLSPGNTLGYYKDPETTAALFTPDGYLKTGDRGELDAEGRLRITGRVKDLFKTSKGKYVAPAPIENRLIAHDLIEQACVTGVGQPQPCALVVLADDARARLDAGTLTREAIAAALAAHVGAINVDLNPHERLQVAVVAREPWLTENGMLTPTLKVKRRAVEDAFGARLGGWYDADRPVVWE